MKCTIIFSVLLLVACSHAEEASNLQAILTILKQDQQAHLQKNVDSLLSNVSADFIEINRGKVKKPTHEETKTRFTNYFNSVNFLSWKDRTDPIISFSNDSSMAYAILQKQVITTPIENPSAIPDTTNFAWVSIMRKSDGHWNVECITSTNQ